jgi:hypothetical protein
MMYERENSFELKQPFEHGQSSEHNRSSRGSFHTFHLTRILGATHDIHDDDYYVNFVIVPSPVAGTHAQGTAVAAFFEEICDRYK